MKTKVPRYPLWSARAILWISLPALVTTAMLVFWLSNRSFLAEVGITTGIIALGLFIFMTFGLYQGVRLEKPVKVDPTTTTGEGFDPSLALVSPIDIPKVDVDLPNLGDAGDDLVGCLLSILLWFVISLVLVFVFWLLTQVVALALPWILIALYWLYYRALRIVFAKSRVTRGRLGLSLGWGLLYTVLYTGWVFVLLGVLQLVRMWIQA